MVTPATVADAYALLREAIADPRPGGLPGAQEALLVARTRWTSPRQPPAPFGTRRGASRAGHRRHADRLRPVACPSRSRPPRPPRPRAGTCEVVDLRSLVPFDDETVVRVGPRDRPRVVIARGARASPVSAPRSPPGCRSAASTPCTRRCCGSPASTSRTRRRSWSTPPARRRPDPRRRRPPAVGRRRTCVRRGVPHERDRDARRSSCCRTWARGSPRPRSSSWLVAVGDESTSTSRRRGRDRQGHRGGALPVRRTGAPAARRAGPAAGRRDATAVGRDRRLGRPGGPPAQCRADAAGAARALAQYREEEQAGSATCSSGTAPPRPGGPGVAASALRPRRRPPRRPADTGPCRTRPCRGRAGSTRRGATGGPGHLAARAAAGPRPRHRPGAPRAPASPDEILRRRDVEAAIARPSEASPVRTPAAADLGAAARRLRPPVRGRRTPRHGRPAPRTTCTSRCAASAGPSPTS